MKKGTKLVTVVISVVFVSYLFVSCATLFKGTSEEINFNSDPTGAQVFINGNFTGTTPLSIKLESKKTYTIEFQKKGYAPQTVTITNRVGTVWIILDVLGGLIPVIIDAATGAWYVLDQKNVNAILQKIEKNQQ
ncbi:MAG: PEGA domain-containing protein [Acidobacteriota bacterium]